MVLIAAFVAAFFAPSVQAQPDSTFIANWASTAQDAGLFDVLDEIKTKVDRVSTGPRHGRRTMDAPGIAFQRRYEERFKAAVFTDVLRLVNNDSSRVAPHPYFVFQMNQLKDKRKTAKLAAEVGVAELLAALDQIGGLRNAANGISGYGRRLAALEDKIGELTQSLTAEQSDLDKTKERLAVTEEGLRKTLNLLISYGNKGIERKDIPEACQRVLEGLTAEE